MADNRWEITCPEDITVQLGPELCNTSVVFDTAFWSSTEDLVDTIFFPPSGSIFGIGSAQVTLAATTVAGDLEVCTFNIIVNEFQPQTLDCIQNLSVDLNGECERIFEPGELLLADSIGCINNYVAIRLSASGEIEMPVISSADIGQTFLAAVQHQTNNMQCLTHVTVSGGTPPSITCPPDITLACNSFLFPSITGMPDTSGCFQNVTITFSDVTAATLCTDSIGFQTTRSWVATDPLGNVDVCEQMITGKRFNLNNVQFPPNYDGTEFMPLHCEPGMTLQEITNPIFTGEPMHNNFPADNNPGCDITVNYIDMLNNTCGAAFEITRIWTVVNLCNQMATVKDTQYIHVLDTAPPQFSIPDTLFASVDQRCFDSLFLPSLENVIECSSYSVEIRTPWDTLYSDGGWSPIELTVGNYVVNYKVTDACGNTSFAIVTLAIENENLVSCPPNDTITCDFYFSTIAPAIGLNNFEVLNELGVPEYHGNCNFTFSETDSVSINNCGSGSVFRMLTSDSVNVGNCIQEITVQHVSNFSAIFPPDTSICVDPTTADLGQPTLLGVSCENMTTTFTDNVIIGDVADCYTLERKWIIRNACSYNNVNTQDDTSLVDLQFMDGGDGIIEYVQTIAVNDTDGPVFSSSCGFPDLYLFSNSCEITVTAPTPEVAGCGEVLVSLSGDLGAVPGADIKLGTGGYSMTFTAIDECGKITVCQDSFLVLDTISPVALCKPQLTVNLPAANPPLVEVSASDFDDGSYDNCGDVLQFYFLADSLESSITLGCCELESPVISLVVVDEFGNQSTCETMLFVQDSLNLCGDCNPLPQISGLVFTEENIGINNVDINVEAIAGPPQNLSTDSDGIYALSLEPNDDYSIIPEKNNNHLNGVTTFDAVLMTRHILNVELLDSPYKIIAADINNSKTVTTFDVVVMRKLILNIYSNYPNNSSWRFVPADYIFPNPLNPFQEDFPETININNLNGNLSELNFVGVKVGDLNNSADPKE